MDNKKVYSQWNGKNINGQVEFNNNFISSEAARSNTREMECTVGVDTFSANDLQQNLQD